MYACVVGSCELAEVDWQWSGGSGIYWVPKETRTSLYTRGLTRLVLLTIGVFCIQYSFVLYLLLIQRGIWW